MRYEELRKWKYRLLDNESVETEIDCDVNISSPYIEINCGILTVREGYCWDGASGPAIDTATIMRGSLFHDALYQLMRENKLDRDEYRAYADRLLKEICLKDGMSKLRAWWVHLAVKTFAKRNTKPTKNNRIVTI